MVKKIIFLIVVLMTCLFVGWYYYTTMRSVEPAPAPVVQKQPEPVVVPKKEEPVVPFTEGKVSLKENSSAKLGDLVFSVLKIYDSRCRPDVQCVWAGELKADILAEFGGQIGTTTIKAGSEAVSLVGLFITASSSDQMIPGDQPFKMTFSIIKQ